MEYKELIERIKEIEEKFIPVVDILENDSKYQELYKGIISIQSKVSYEPDILFIGINPGQGAFLKKNSKTGKSYYFPKEFFSENSELNWLEYGNARKGGKWFEILKNENNPFPRKMLEILFQVAKSKFQVFDLSNILHREKFINQIANKIVYTNVCPIATENEAKLKNIYRKLSQEEVLKDHWKGTVENFFKQRTIDLILTINPKIIVCIGKSVHKSLFLEKISKDERVVSSTSKLKRKEIIYPFETITFSRKGAWDIDKISKLIIKKAII